jgi:hypothetical protein
MDLKIYTLAKKPAAVTRQLTKSKDFRQNYLCDFHLWSPVMYTLYLSVLPYLLGLVLGSVSPKLSL